MADVPKTELIYRQTLPTRITHWIWTLCLFFLLLTGLQIFNAHPTLNVGLQSGFEFDNTLLSMSAENTDNGPKGVTTVLGRRFDTTGVFGLSYEGEKAVARGFPAWATIPSIQDLATARVIHFFFAWLLLFTLLLWTLASIVNGHLQRDITPTITDFRRIPHDVVEHLKLRFDHGGRYNALQKISYASVLLVLLPIMILTGLCMSPGMNAFAPWLLDVFGGRQTARTVHFIVMTLLVGFFVIHIAMVLLAGPFNEIRSMITGWYRRKRPAPGSQFGD